MTRPSFTLVLVVLLLAATPALSQPAEPAAPPPAEPAEAPPAEPAGAEPDTPALPPSDGNPAADAAFRAGMELMHAGRFREACHRLEESLQLDDGMATRFRLGECYERLGRLASAWRIFVQVAEAAHSAGMSERAAFARGRAAGLEPRLTRLAVEVPAAVAAVPGVQITVDGTPLSKASWGQPAAVDPGEHRVAATAPGRLAWRRRVVARGEGRTTTLSVPPWSEPDRPSGADDGLPTQAIVGIVLGATGIVAAGVGIGVGIAASNRYDESAAYCIDDYCHPEGLAIREEAINQADLATLVVAIGGVAVAGGIVLWWTASSPDGEKPANRGEAAVAIQLGPAGAALEASW